MTDDEILAQLESQLEEVEVREPLLFATLVFTPSQGLEILEAFAHVCDHGCSDDNRLLVGYAMSQLTTVMIATLLEAGYDMHPAMPIVNSLQGTEHHEVECEHDDPDWDGLLG